MNALINIQSRDISGAAIQTVNARDLWAFLESRQEFAHWIKGRVEKYGFAEGSDYLLDKFIRQVPHQGGERQQVHIDYHLTLGTAKELAMVEKNDKGREVRRYFIDCERKASQPVDPVQMLNDPAAMRGILLTYTEKVLALQEKIAEAQPKVEFCDAVTENEGCKTIQETAKILNTGGNRLFDFMRERGVLGKDNVPYQKHINSGHFKLRYSEYVQPDGSTNVNTRTLVTGSGVVFLFKLLQAV